MDSGNRNPGGIPPENIRIVLPRGLIHDDRDSRNRTGPCHREGDRRTTRGADIGEKRGRPGNHLYHPVPDPSKPIGNPGGREYGILTPKPSRPPTRNQRGERVTRRKASPPFDRSRSRPSRSSPPFLELWIRTGTDTDSPDGIFPVEGTSSQRGNP